MVSIFLTIMLYIERLDTVCDLNASNIFLVGEIASFENIM